MIKGRAAELLVCGQGEEIVVVLSEDEFDELIGRIEALELYCLPPEERYGKD